MNYNLYRFQAQQRHNSNSSIPVYWLVQHNSNSCSRFARALKLKVLSLTGKIGSSLMSCCSVTALIWKRASSFLCSYHWADSRKAAHLRGQRTSSSKQHFCKNK